MTPDRISTREKMLKLLRKEDIDEFIVSPVVESDFAASITGRKFPSEVTDYDPYFYAAEECGYDPIFQVTYDLGNCDPQLKIKVDIIEKTETFIKRKHLLETPRGNLKYLSKEEVGLVPFGVEVPPLDEKFFKILEWYFEKIASSNMDHITSESEKLVRMVGDKGLTRIEVGNTAELAFARYPELLLGYMGNPELYLHTMDVYFEAQKVLMKAALNAGVDLIYASGVGTEMTSPEMFSETFLPFLTKQRQFTQEHRGYFFYHSCGHTKDFIERGYYNQIAPDIFETLSPPPEGKISDLRKARQSLIPEICTKGNVSCELIRTGSHEEITETTKAVIDSTAGYRQMVGLADSVLYGTPPENLRCMVDAVRDYKKSDK